MLWGGGSQVSKACIGPLLGAVVTAAFTTELTATTLHPVEFGQALPQQAQGVRYLEVVAHKSQGPPSQVCKMPGNFTMADPEDIKCFFFCAKDAGESAQPSALVAYRKCCGINKLYVAPSPLRPLGACVEALRTGYVP